MGGMVLFKNIWRRRILYTIITSASVAVSFAQDATSDASQASSMRMALSSAFAHLAVWGPTISRVDAGSFPGALKCKWSDQLIGTEFSISNTRVAQARSTLPIDRRAPYKMSCTIPCFITPDRIVVWPEGERSEPQEPIELRFDLDFTDQIRAHDPDTRGFVFGGLIYALIGYARTPEHVPAVLVARPAGPANLGRCGRGATHAE